MRKSAACTFSLAMTWAMTGIASSPALAGAAQEPANPLYRPRISAFVVGSFGYQSHVQMVPEFAGAAPLVSEPKATNFSFDKVGLAVFQRFTPWVAASVTAEVETHRERHSHGFDPDFGCPGTSFCEERFGGEEAEVEASLDLFEITATLPVGNGPTVSLGRFDIPFGIERHDEPLLLTATHSHAFRFGRPERMTGLRVAYTFAPWLDVTGWVVNRWENEFAGAGDFDDNNKGKSLGGRVGLTPFPLRGLLNIGLGGFWGPEQEGTTENTRWIADLDATWTPVPALLVAGEFLYGEEAGVSLRERGAPIAAPEAVADVRWRGGYLLAHYDPLDRLGVSVRYEVLDDPDGGRTGVSQTLQSFTIAPILHLSRIDSEIGTTGSTYARTRHPIDWVDLRIEYRLDRSNRAVFSDAEPGEPIAAPRKTSHQVVVRLVVNSIVR